MTTFPVLYFSSVSSMISLNGFSDESPQFVRKNKSYCLAHPDLDERFIPSHMHQSGVKHLPLHSWGIEGPHYYSVQSVQPLSSPG